MSKYQFSDLAEFITDKIAIDQLELNQYISTDNMLPNLCGVVSAEKFPTGKNCNHFRKGDVLFSNIRTYFKKVWLSEFDGGCSADVLIARSKDEDILLTEYLYLVMCSDDFINFTNASSKGSKMPRGDKNAILKYEIEVPDIETQRKFIEIYLAFNNKIQLNTQINQTLEQMAAAIFKSWFIDFDPVRAKADAIAQGADHEQVNIAAMTAISGKTAEELAALPSENYTELYTLADNFPSELEMVDGVEVPKGWGYDKLNNLFNVGIGKTPPRKEEHWFTENTNDVEWISIKDMGNQGAFIMQSSEYLKEEAIEKFKIKVIPQNTVILSFKLTLGRVAITTKNTTTNEAIAHFKLNKNTKLSTEYLYLWLKQYDFGSLGSTSSIATAVNSKTIKDMLILIPNSKLLDFFNKKIGVFFEKIRNTTEENISLEEMRDLLLPKLLSGEIEL